MGRVFESISHVGCSRFYTLEMGERGGCLLVVFFPLFFCIKFFFDNMPGFCISRSKVRNIVVFF